jgi:hypothetical protein
MQKAMTIQNVESVRVELSDAVRSLVAEALADCQGIKAVTDPLDFDASINAQRAAAQLRKSIDSQRKEITRPLDDVKSKCIALVEELLVPLAAEEHRLSGMNAAYEAERRRKAEEEARRIRAAALLAEREAEAKAAQERQRIADQQRADAARASAQERAAIEARAGEEMRLAEERAAAAAEASRLQAMQQLSTLQTPTTGAAMLTHSRYEITDLAACYAARPEWFELKPRDGIIKSALKVMDETTQIPGMRHWKEQKLSTR